MPSFNIARAGSSYPRMGRNEVEPGTIFKLVSDRDSNTLGQYSMIHAGMMNNRCYSLRINDNKLTSSPASDRAVAMVGKAQFNRTFFNEDEHVTKSLEGGVVSDIFVIKGRVNADNLPIAYGLLGQMDNGNYIAIDFSELGKIVEFPAHRSVTVVGKFGVTGTEV